MRASYRGLEPSIVGGSVVVQDDRTKWTVRAGAVTSGDLHWRMERDGAESVRLAAGSWNADEREVEAVL